MLAERMRTTFAWLVFAAAALLAGPLWAGKLDDIRDQNSGSSSHRDDDDDDDDDDDGGSILGAILNAIFSSSSDDDDPGGEVGSSTEERPPGPRPMYLAHPYAAGQPGSLRLVSQERTAEPEPSLPPVKLKPARVQLWSEGAGDWAGLYRGTLGVSAQLAGSVGVETRASLWYEPLPDKDDQLFYWDTNLLLELAVLPELQPYLGAGLRVQLDPTGRSEGVMGAHGLLRFDVYPARPLVLHFGATLGGLGRSFMFEGQGSIGIELDRAELYAGYSTWVIGQTVLQGPLAGVRVTF